MGLTDGERRSRGFHRGAPVKRDWCAGGGSLPEVGPCQPDPPAGRTRSDTETNELSSRMYGRAEDDGCGHDRQTGRTVTISADETNCVMMIFVGVTGTMESGDGEGTPVLDVQFVSAAGPVCCCLTVELRCCAPLAVIVRGRRQAASVGPGRIAQSPDSDLWFKSDLLF